MMKPTAFQFFTAEIVIWILVLFLIGYYQDWNSKMALSIFFMKMSVTNVGIAMLNMVGACVGMATGFFPWRS